VTDSQSFQVVRAGRLLVANPLLPDPNFDRTVVLLLAYGEEGALGLVLNRPSDMLVAAPLPMWEELAAKPPVIFVGGPVQHQAVICLARTSGQTPASPASPASEANEDDPLSEGFRAVIPDVGTLDLDLDSDLQPLRDAYRHVRVFAGYAGWAAGQLEGEIAAGAWWAVDALPDDPFSDDPETLWKRVLRRQGGSLALVASYPRDPMMN
jgi:putative transcriptional regulator